MGVGLPSMKYADGIRTYTQAKFGGYNHTAGASGGEIFDMENMTGDFYPLLSPRRPRYRIRTLACPNGLYAKDGLYYVDGTQFFADGVFKGTVTDGRKQFVGMGAYIIILPDMKYYDRVNDTFGSLSQSFTGAGVLKDGTYAGEEAAANTVYAVGAGALFRVGDAVTVSGCVRHPENNKTAIIREIDGDNLRFSENCFVIDTGGDAETLTLSRTVPQIDYACENENRLWGCKGDTIYASKLGDPFNFSVYDGVSTDSFTVDVGSAGDFTGCASYLGYPCFFKEEHIYKVYGDRPANFQVMSSASLGVEAGSHGSLAIAGEVLFYLSRVGVVAYSGGIPQNISAPFGTERYKNAVAGSDGVKYYISMEDTEGKYHLFVYDTRRGLWHREDGTEAVGFGWNRELYFLSADGVLWLGGGAREVPTGAVREAVPFFAEFADFYGGGTDSPLGVKKHISKILLRMELGEGSHVRVEVQFDGGAWETVATMQTERKRSYYLPVIPRRSDHFRLRLAGEGECRLYSVVRQMAAGSEND